LVVDDDPIFRLLVDRVARQLQRHHLIKLCSRLQDAERWTNDTDLWVIDVHLPDGTGPDWVKQKRENGFGQPVLLISHGPCPVDLEPLQPCCFRPKPSSLEDLRQLMQGWWIECAG
jgi:CheY-like chemotaxis protein